MAAQLHYLDHRRLIGPNGVASGASVYFYQTGTTTPVRIYSDVGLTVELANPVVVNAGGQIPDIYYDDATTIRRYIVYADGSADDLDPYVLPNFLSDAEAAANAAGAAATTAGAAAQAASDDADQTAADVITTAANVALSETAKTDAQTAAAAAVAAGNIFADIAAGLAGTASGEYFFVEDADDNLQLYLNNAGSEVAQGFVLPGYAAMAGILDIGEGYLPVTRKSSGGGSTNLQYASDDYWERTTGTGSMLHNIPLLSTDMAEANIYVHFPFTGSFSDVPDAQLFNGGTSIGSRIDGVVVGSEYVVTLPISGSPDRIRVRWATTSDGRVKDPYVTYDGQSLVDPTTVAGKRKIAEWIDEIVASSGNMIAPDFSLVGNAVVADDDRTVAFATNRNNDLVRQYVAGVAGASDYVNVLVRVDNSTGLTWRDVRIDAETGLSGGTTTTEFQVYRYGDYAVFRTLASGGGNNARYMEIIPDTRANGTAFPATALTLQFLGVFIGDFDPAKLMADPDALLQACADKAQREAFVGSTLTGVANYATLPEAVRAGFGKIKYCSAHERLTEGCFVPPYAEIENAGGGILSCGVSRVIGDFTATAADANVYFVATGYDPRQVWEVTTATGAVDPLGDAPASGADLFLWEEAANEAGVQAVDGTFWYGAGSEGTGLYMRPRGDVTAGKTWEVPAENGQNVITAWRGASLVKMVCRYAFGDGIYTDKGCLSTKFCEANYNGQNGIFLNTGASLTDTASEATGNANDGINWNGSGGQIHLGGSRSHGNRQDGVAGGHGNGYTQLTGNFTADGNGKQGLVTVGPTDFDGTVRAFGNRSQDVLWLVSVNEPSAISAIIDTGNSGVVSITNSANTDAIIGAISGVWGTLTKTSSAFDAFQYSGTAT